MNLKFRKNLLNLILQISFCKCGRRFKRRLCLQEALETAVSMKDLSIVVDILNKINLQP